MTAASGGKQRVRDLLADSDVFGALADDDLDRLIARGQIAAYAAGNVIFQRGDRAKGMMIVLSGRIRISTLSPEGKEAILGFIDPGHCFGEIELLDGKTRSADAAALKPSEVFMLGREVLTAFVERHPDIAFRIIGVLCAKLRRTTEMMEDALLLSMASRIAKVLLRLASDYGSHHTEDVRIDLKLSQRELGALVGASREQVNRQLGAWRDAGVIVIDEGRLMLHNLEALRAIAAGRAWRGSPDSQRRGAARLLARPRHPCGSLPGRDPASQAGGHCLGGSGCRPSSSLLQH